MTKTRFPAFVQAGIEFDNPDNSNVRAETAWGGSPTVIGTSSTPSKINKDRPALRCFLTIDQVNPSYRFPSTHSLRAISRLARVNSTAMPDVFKKSQNSRRRINSGKNPRSGSGKLSTYPSGGGTGWTGSSPRQTPRANQRQNVVLPDPGVPDK